MTPGLMMSLDPVTEEPHPIRNVKTIGCGNYHSLIVVVEKSVNTIYACGLNNYGQLGLGSNKPHDYLTPINTQWNGSVVQVAGGVHHSLALVHNNSSGSGNTSELYAWGRCDSGQLGVHRETKQAGDFVDAPVCVTIPDILSIQQISCGGNHNLALVTNNSNTNDVYSWGYGDMLALGHGVEKDEFVPKKINWNKCKDINNKKLKSMNISQVAGGGQHSAIIGTVIDTI